MKFFARLSHSHSYNQQPVYLLLKHLSSVTPTQSEVGRRNTNTIFAYQTHNAKYRRANDYENRTTAFYRLFEVLIRLDVVWLKLEVLQRCSRRIKTVFYCTMNNELIKEQTNMDRQWNGSNWKFQTKKLENFSSLWSPHNIQKVYSTENWVICSIHEEEKKSWNLHKIHTILVMLLAWLRFSLFFSFDL